jgi:hypothetical protein
VRWFVVLACACSGPKPAPLAPPLERAMVVRARVVDPALPGSWLDVVVDGWRAQRRCEQLVATEVERGKQIVRACNEARLPASASYELVTTRRSLFDVPNALLSRIDVVTYDSLHACEQQRIKIDADERQVFEESEATRLRKVRDHVDLDKLEAMCRDQQMSCAQFERDKPRVFRPPLRVCRSAQ